MKFWTVFNLSKFATISYTSKSKRIILFLFVEFFFASHLKSTHGDLVYVLTLGKDNRYLEFTNYIQFREQLKRVAITRRDVPSVGILKLSIRSYWKELFLVVFIKTAVLLKAVWIKAILARNDGVS